MIRQLRVEHVTFVSDRAFEAVVRDFEAQVGSLETVGWSAIGADASDRAKFERAVESVLGPSGFTRFLTIDHGRWLTQLGRPTKFVQYTLGNPLIALTMLEHDIEAGLDVPVRIAIYEHGDGRTRLVYDTPSSLMSGLDNDALRDAAGKLDAKMMALAEAVTGATA